MLKRCYYFEGGNLSSYLTWEEDAAEEALSVSHLGSDACVAEVVFFLRLRKDWASSLALLHRPMWSGLTSCFSTTLKAFE